MKFKAQEDNCHLPLKLQSTLSFMSAVLLLCCVHVHKDRTKEKKADASTIPSIHLFSSPNFTGYLIVHSELKQHWPARGSAVLVIRMAPCCKNTLTRCPGFNKSHRTTLKNYAAQLDLYVTDTTSGVQHLVWRPSRQPKRSYSPHCNQEANELPTVKL